MKHWQSCWMLLSLRNASPALGVELNTLLLQGVQTMDRYPQAPFPTVPIFSLPHTSHLSFIPSFKACHPPPPSFNLGLSFYIKSQLSFDFLLAFVFESLLLSFCGHHCYTRLMLVLSYSQFSSRRFILDLISFVDMFYMILLYKVEYV